MNISVPSETVEQAVREELKRVSKMHELMVSVRVKFLLRIIEKRFGASVRHDVLGDLLQKHFFNVAFENKVNLAGRPTFAVEQFEAGKI